MAVQNNKNGLLELIRFLCALWVAYFHGFSPVLTDNFRGVVVPVEMFFIISGYFFLKSLEKYKEKPLGKGMLLLFWDRIKRFIVPLVLAALSVLYCNIAFAWEFNGFNWPFSFLWFFAAQFVFMSLFFLLARKSKGRRAFNIACGVIICISMSLHSVLSIEMDRVARSPAAIAIGILLSQLPKIKAGKLSAAINAIGLAVSAAAFVYLAWLPGYAVWRLHLLICMVGPAVIYFAAALPVRSKFLSFLGECSIFIYLAQCPVLLHHYYVSRDTRDQFPLLCICAVGMFVLNRMINKIGSTEKSKPA